MLPCMHAVPLGRQPTNSTHQALVETLCDSDEVVLVEDVVEQRRVSRPVPGHHLLDVRTHVRVRTPEAAVPEREHRANVRGAL